MRKSHYGFVAVSLLLIFAGVFLMREEPRSSPKSPLMLYCAAGLRQPVERIVSEYQARYGISVRVQFGGSTALFAQIETAKMGDLFITADPEFITLGTEKGEVREIFPIARQAPVIGIKKGNPKGIHGLNDLLGRDVQTGFASPAAAIGKVTDSLLKRAGLFETLDKKKKASFATVMELGNAIALGAVDAGIVWDASAAQLKDLETVPLPDSLTGQYPVEACVLAFSRAPDRALHFARYLTAPGKGLAHFEAFSFRTTPGDSFAERPRISLYCGGVLRPSVQDIVEEFKTRENVDVDVQFNGCGILLGSIRAGFKPDAYFACDKSFAEPVANEFFEIKPITRTEIVLIAPKGNPKEIRTLSDLAREGLKIGLAHEEKSTLGALTRDLLNSAGLYGGVKKNTVVDPATADILVSSLLLGAIDAAIVYRANTTPQKEKLEVYSLKESGPRYATQTIAVHRGSAYPNLTARLFAKVEKSKDVFTAHGFEWLGQ